MADPRPEHERQQQEAVLRLRARGYAHLEERITELFHVTLNDRFVPNLLLSVAGNGIVLRTRDLESLDEVVVKFPFFDWSRPGRITIEELDAKRGALRREAEFLRSGNGRILPGFVAEFTEENRLIVEPQPRLSPGEQFLAMEWIDAPSVDAAAREAAERKGRRTANFAVWVAELVCRICSALEQIHSDLPRYLFADVSPKNFLLHESGTVRVIDAGSLARRDKKGKRAPYTSPYCPLNDRERELPLDEGIVARRLGMLGIDLLTDQLSLSTHPDEAVAAIRSPCNAAILDVLDNARRQHGKTIGDLRRSLVSALERHVSH